MGILDGMADASGRVAAPEMADFLDSQAEMFGRTLADVPGLTPEENDPNVLFRNNWLARGQSVELVASSGVGKSSMTMQTAFHWAAGEKFLAEPYREMKCAIIQAEDSERDVAEQISGMKQGLMRIEGWSESKFEEVKARVLCPTCFVGVQGDAFISMLRDFQAWSKCDMLFINPVQAFFGGDVSDQKEVSHWTRAGLDPIIKDTRYSCGAFLVCHTTKFTSGDTKGRANVEDYGEYIGAGSHEWLDWCRAKFVFLKHGKSDTYFDFKAAKRGKRLKWEDPFGNQTTSKIFKHSADYIYWKEVTEYDELQAIGVARKEPAESVMTDDDKITIAMKMVDWIRNNRAVTGRELWEKSDAFKGLGLTRIQLRAGGQYIKVNWKDLHMQKTTYGYGFAEGIRVLEKQRVQQDRIKEGI